MTPSVRFTATPTRPSPSSAEVALTGDLDLASAAILRSTCEPLLGDAAIDRLVLDLTDLRFVDSSGVKVFIDLHLVMSRRGSLTLRAPSRAVRRVLELMALDEHFAIEPAV